MRGYIPPEEIKEKKQKTEIEMVDIFLETASFSSSASLLDIGPDKIPQSAEALIGAANSEAEINLDTVHKTEKFARTYEAIEYKILSEKEKREKRKKADISLCLKAEKDI